VTPVYAASESPIEGCDHESLAALIRQSSFPESQNSVETCQNLDQAVSLATTFACKHRKDPDRDQGVLIITLGAGDVQSVGPMVLKKLSVS
jgi:UDP-N-acetylmuramate-alanine ligase